MINRFSIIIIFLSLYCVNLFAQGEGNIWYFGKGFGLDFNDGEPKLLKDGALNTFEGVATMSDYKGDLLFYTDGKTVWNRMHQIMNNGEGLKGSFSTTQSALVVPNPNLPNIYYIFTPDDVLAYS